MRRMRVKETVGMERTRRLRRRMWMRKRDNKKRSIMTRGM